MAIGVAGSTLTSEMNRVANGGTYPAMTAYKALVGAANAALSTRLGYFRPAALARARAAAFCAEVSFVDVFFGFFLSQNSLPFTISPYLPNMLLTFCP